MKGLDQRIENVKNRISQIKGSPMTIEEQNSQREHLSKVLKGLQELKESIN